MPRSHALPKKPQLLYTRNVNVTITDNDVSVIVAALAFEAVVNDSTSTLVFTPNLGSRGQWRHHGRHCSPRTPAVLCTTTSIAWAMQATFLSTSDK